jgi:hypothetical protein
MTSAVDNTFPEGNCTSNLLPPVKSIDKGKSIRARMNPGMMINSDIAKKI